MAAPHLLFPSPDGFDERTEANEVAKKFSSTIAGKTILITGVAEGGLGEETALSIATASPELLILSTRSKARAQPVASKLSASFPKLKVQILEMDFGSLASVRKAAAKLADSVDVLINNAAVMGCPYSTTSDGFETQFGVNHLGHFLFTILLLKGDKIRDGGRIVNVSSNGHRMGDIRFNDPGFENGNCYNQWAAYGQAKTANMLFSLSLADRLKSKKISSFSLHPGVIVDTNLGRSLDDQNMAAMMEQDRVMGIAPYEFKMKTKQQGAATHLVAAFDPSIAKYNGAFLQDCAIWSATKAYAADPEGAERLWVLSEKLVGEKF